MKAHVATTYRKSQRSDKKPIQPTAHYFPHFKSYFPKVNIEVAWEAQNSTSHHSCEGDKHCLYKDIRRQSQRLQGVSDDLPSQQDPSSRVFLEDDGSTQPSVISQSYGSNGTHHCDLGDGMHTFTTDQSVNIADNSLRIADAINPRHSPAFDGFYSSFFKGHPFVLPKFHLLQLFDRDPLSVTNVIKAIAFIGSLYIRDAASPEYRAAVEVAITKGLPHNGFSVQCLLLFAGALEWSGEQDKAASVLRDTKSMALGIKMNSQSFASKNGQRWAILEDSWRRTWWELYIIDSIFAGIRHLPTFDLWNEEGDVDLPCEEMDYVKGDISLPRTLVEYDDRAFEDGHSLFSSFAYLIDAARILGSTLSIADKIGDSVLPTVKNAEANIASWHLYLPDYKKEPVQVDGSVDEIMFRAHMFINTVTTHLHRPQSRLHSSTMEILCSQYAHPQHSKALLVNYKNERHTFQAVQSARTCVELFTLTASPTTHTPFIMCMGSMATATHISACEYYLKGSEYAHAKDRVRVFLGVLKAFEDIWPQARKWSGEVKLMAKAVFENRDKTGELLLAGSVDSMNGVEGFDSSSLGLDLVLLRSCFAYFGDE
ncbi:hypothetical protein QQS21_007804 [Conoideocrella luteorostrata]|uniref:Xylanolytic transcriptional activator regulatory domain-containing protein n=1 Tax=Conoideocrella luteorostrata TaxID=1105319 RepID=A0AAJ0CJZ9_9HYPO|nr:hypothetical protein QQS21_007804 [Conoideocrella luteorostrata]